jgi:hypothetical protein
LVQLAAQVGLHGRQGILLKFGIDEAGLDVVVRCLPQAAQEAVSPSTPASDHSSDWSGGEANMMNRRAVSAPYWSIRACGSTPLFFDFDIFSVPPITTGRPSVSAWRPSAGPSSVTTSTSAGLIHCFLPPSRSR